MLQVAHRSYAGVLAGCLLGLLAGCVPSTQADEQGAWVEQEVDFRRQVDLLLLVDDSETMRSKSRALVQGLSGLSSVLLDPWQPVDLRVAALPTRAGLRAGPGAPCENRSFGPRYLLAPKSAQGEWKCAQGTSQDRAFASVGACLSIPQHQGCGRNSVMTAMHAGLEGELAPWLREKALLAAILLTDDRDCSLPPTAKSESFAPAPDVIPGMDQGLEEGCFLLGAQCDGAAQGDGAAQDAYAHCEIRSKTEDSGLPGLRSPDDLAQALLATKKGRAERVILSTISGAQDDEGSMVYPRPLGTSHKAPGPGCVRWDAPSALKTAGSLLRGSRTLSQAPIRLRSLAEQLTTPQEQAVFPICMADLRRPLYRIAKQIQARLEPLCIQAPLSDAERPRCEVIEHGPQGSAPLPECERSPAYRVDPAGQGLARPVGASHCFALKSDRDGKQSPDPYDDLSPRCQTQAARLELELHAEPGWVASPQTRWTLRCSEF